MNTQIFFDLEDTLIAPVLDGWHNSELILHNIEFFKEQIEEFDPVCINIFSFALHDVEQIRLFNKHTRPSIEEALNHKLHLIPGVDSAIIPAVQRQLKVQGMLFEELITWVGKERAFELFIKDRFKDNDLFVLFDDMVPDKSIIPVEGPIIRMIHVK